MTRHFKVVDEKKLEKSSFTGNPRSAASKAANELLGDVKTSKTATIKVRETGSDKVCEYKVTKTKLAEPQVVTISSKDGTSKTITYKYKTTATRVKCE